MRNNHNNRSSRSQASKGSASTARNAGTEKIIRTKSQARKEALKMIELDEKYNLVSMAVDVIGQLHTYSENDLAKIMKDLTLLTMSKDSENKEVHSDCVTSLGQIAEMIVFIASNRQELDKITDFFLKLQQQMEGEMSLED